MIIQGDCIEVMAQLRESSVDAIVTDPPYGLGFMGKGWDELPPGEEWAEACLRVLKPGGHLLAFGGTRTWHRLAVAIEDAGFEMRDSIAWLYGSGFPKSRNVGKDVAEFEGWGTALKPAFEPVVVARKPLVGTVASNVQEFGTGGLNIDACRIGTTDAGRWPANVVLDESTAAELDEQSGVSTSRQGKRNAPKDAGTYGAFAGDDPDRLGHSDSGGASRFFYCAKAPRKERPLIDGKGHPTVKPVALMRWLVRMVTPPGGVVLDPFLGSGTTAEAAELEGFRWVGIEREAEYVALSQARVDKLSGGE